MKTLKIQNPKKQRAKRNLVFTALMLFMCILMISNAVSQNKNFKEENFDVVEGVVTHFEELEEHYQFSIKVEEKRTVALSIKKESSTALPRISENLKFNDDIILVYKKVTDEMVIIVYSKDEVKEFKKTKEVELIGTSSNNSMVVGLGKVEIKDYEFEHVITVTSQKGIVNTYIIFRKLVVDVN